MNKYLFTGISGCIASLVSNTITYPIYSHYLRTSAKHNSSHVYAGYTTFIIANALSQLVYYMFYSLFIDIFMYINLYLPASFFAGCITVLLVNPIWVINTHMCVYNKSLINILKDMKYSDYYCGIGPSLILVLNPTIQYSCYEYIHMYIIDSVVWKAFISKCIATILTYPYIYVKSLSHVYKQSMVSICKNIYINNGVSGFYTNISTKSIHSILTAIILMYTHHIIINL